MKKCIILVILSLLFGCSSELKDIPTTVSKAQAFGLETVEESEVSIRYLQFLPDDYEKRNDWPLLLFLHGAGERGNDLAKVAVHGPPKLAARGELQEFIVVAPQCPQGDYWDSHQQQTNLMTLIKQLSENLDIDEDRIYLTGLSMGGFGTWQLAATLNNEIAAAAPVCGGGSVWNARLLSDVPIWAFHGAKDDVVPAELSEEMVEAINNKGGEARLTIFPDANHNSWDPTYEGTPELYDWLLMQNLKNRE